MSTLRRALGLRLSMWYAAVFTISTIGLVAITYALIAQSLAQRERAAERAHAGGRRASSAGRRT